jgi:Holliday junction resolvase RusA-like endonuclease
MIFYVDVDPRRVRINIRNRDNRYIPPDVASAQREIVEQIREQAGSKYGWDNYHPPTGKRYSVTFFFAVPNRSSDYDGPVKRVQDSLATALSINDGLIEEGRAVRVISDKPGIMIMLRSYEKNPMLSQSLGRLLVKEDFWS